MADDKGKEKSGISIPFMIAYTAVITIIVCAVAFGIGYKMIFKKPADLKKPTDIKAIAHDPESEVAVDHYKKITLEAQSSVIQAATTRVPLDKLTFNLTSSDPKKKSFLVATFEVVLLDYYTLMKLNDIESNPKNKKMWDDIEKGKGKEHKNIASQVSKSSGGEGAKEGEEMVLRVKYVFDEEHGALMDFLNMYLPTYSPDQVHNAEVKEEITEKIKEKINEILEHHSKGLGQCTEVNIVKWVVS